MTLESDSIRAVLDTHVDLEAWLVSGDPVAWRRFEESLADDFSLVTPTGVLCHRATVLDELAADGGTAGEGFAIQIEAAGAHRYGDGLALVVYRQLQSGGTRPSTVRWSTAVISRAPDGRMVWRHLHECWTT